MLPDVLTLDKITGAILGTFTGDALGMPVEGWSSWEISERYGEITEILPGRLKAGSYTDDTEMMIGIAESLLECGDFNDQHMALTFSRNFNHERGYGPGTTRVLQLIKSGTPWEQAVQNVFPGGSYGNGAAMRIAPAACLYVGRPDELRKCAAGSARLTHAHPQAVEGAALQASAVALALTADSQYPLDQKGFLRSLKSSLPPEAGEYREKLDCAGKLLEIEPSVDRIVRELGNGVKASQSVCTSIYIFLENYGSFEKAVVKAVSLGGDTDTIGAMTGAISGAYHGRKEIPGRWLDKLEEGQKGRGYVEELAAGLWLLLSDSQSCTLQIKKRKEDL